VIYGRWAIIELCVAIVRTQGALLLLMDGQKADMVFTDPPYGINEKGDRSKRGGATQGGNFKDFIDDSIEYAVKAFNICDELNIPRQVWWGANYYAHHIPQSNNWFVWDKRVEDKQKDTQSDCELAWVKSKWSSVRIFRHLWKGMLKDSERGQSRVHPTQKPVELAIWSFDYFKDVTSVLDLFLGSGSTLIACEKTNRKCYGMELDPHYVDVIIKRWQEFTGKEAVHEDGRKFNEVANVTSS
jgi:site-specific DNA-methyltransferase (adenine-specific)